MGKKVQEEGRYHCAKCQRYIQRYYVFGIENRRQWMNHTFCKWIFITLDWFTIITYGLYYFHYEYRTRLEFGSGAKHNSAWNFKILNRYSRSGPWGHTNKDGDSVCWYCKYNTSKKNQPSLFLSRKLPGQRQLCYIMALPLLVSWHFVLAGTFL